MFEQTTVEIDKKEVNLEDLCVMRLSEKSAYYFQRFFSVEMSNTWYKCRKCGAYLFSDHHLAVTEKAADGKCGIVRTSPFEKLAKQEVPAEAD